MALCGEVNLPALTICESDGKIIYFNGKPLCGLTSRNAHQHFARNDDGNGLERGRLTRSIEKTLSQKDNDHQARWDKVWDDPACQPYRREDYEDYWLWGHQFYEGDIEALRHIARLVGAEGGR